MNLQELTCRKRVALLCGYLDGELPAGLRREIAAHRRGCRPCAGLLRSLRRTVKVLRSLKRASKPSPRARRQLAAACASSRR